jgi:hypothetical protein
LSSAARNGSACARIRSSSDWSIVARSATGDQVDRGAGHRGPIGQRDRVEAPRSAAARARHGDAERAHGAIGEAVELGDGAQVAARFAPEVQNATDRVPVLVPVDRDRVRLLEVEVGGVDDREAGAGAGVEPERRPGRPRR